MGSNSGAVDLVVSKDVREYELREYVPTRLEKAELSFAEGNLLWERYGKYVEVEFPSPKTDNRWQITSQGWVGHVPVSDSLLLRFAPKTPVGNIFRMWEYAYRLKSFHLLESLVGLESVEEFFDQLASVLARRVLDRARRGFYRDYKHEEEHLPYLRGSLQMNERLKRPWEVRLPCKYQEHTADIDENQILLWTLRSVARGYCSRRVAPLVRRAYRSLAGLSSLTPHSSRACVNRLYNRLNDDYQPLHALCRFFLDHTGPTHDAGDRDMIPFLVDMSLLFEMFVAEWLRQHLPEEFVLTSQQLLSFGDDAVIQFSPDLVIADTVTRQPRTVLDTKYKTPESPSARDVEQVVAYAEALGCFEAILLYPVALRSEMNIQVGQVRVRSMSLRLSGDLDEAGRTLLRDLGMGD